MSRYIIYQVKAEPIEVISNAAEAQPIVNWEPHAEVPRFRTRGEQWQRSITQDSGYANPAGYVLPASVQSVAWLFQNPTPKQIHTKRPFHPSLRPAGPDPIWINTRNIRPLSIASTVSVGSPTLLHDGSTTAITQLFIGGTLRYAMVNAVRIEKSIGGRGSMNFTVFSEAGTYRPTDMEEVIYYNRGVRRFGGFVQRVVDEVIEGNDATEVAIQCMDNRGYTDRVVVAKLYPLAIGGTIAIILYDIWWNHLRQFGITFVWEGNPSVLLDEILFHYITVTECFDRLLAKAPGWAWWIDDNKQLHLKQTTSGASFALTDSTLNWERMQVTLEAGLYRNKQWVLPSAPILSQRVETFDSASAAWPTDGTRTNFFTRYILSTKPVVKVDGVEQNVTSLGNWAVPYDWYYIPNAEGVFQKFGATPLTALQTLTVIYPNPWPLAASAQDDAEIAARGLVEAVEHAKDVETLEEAEAIAEGLLEAFSGDGIPEIVEYDTNEVIEPEWPVPGTLQAINVAHPATSGSKTIESVTSELLDMVLWKHKVRARKGNFNSDYQTILETLTKTARANRDRHIAIGELVLAETIVGVTNPGLVTGAVIPSIILEKDCIFDHWSIFPMDATTVNTGADLIVNALLDGTTMFPTSVTFPLGIVAKRIVLPAGQTTEATGFQFREDNMGGSKGQVITFNVTQVGSINPGKDIKIRIVMLAR